MISFMILVVPPKIDWTRAVDLGQALPPCMRMQPESPYS
jgi:hypothetical protein